MPGAQTAFFSYSREDSAFALRLARDLKAAGAKVWIDQADIEPGQEWDSAIEAAVTQSPRMLLILSPSSVKSRNVRNEISFALDENKTIIPVLYQDCTVPLQLRRVQYIDLRTDYSRGLNVLLRTLGVEQRAAVGATAAIVEPNAVHVDQEGKQGAQLLPARAFQCSWLLVLLFMKQARHPGAAEAEIEYHAAQLGLTLPSSWRERLRSDTSEESLKELIEHLSGQMVARHPRLLPYFEAGCNIVVGAARDGPEGVKTAISRLSLPKELSEPRANALSWVNEIHSYFEDALREGET